MFVEVFVCQDPTTCLSLPSGENAEVSMAASLYVCIGLSTCLYKEFLKTVNSADGV